MRIPQIALLLTLGGFLCSAVAPVSFAQEQAGREAQSNSNLVVRIKTLDPSKVAELFFQGVIKRRNIAVFLRAQPLQPGLARMDGHAPHTRRAHGFDEGGQHLGGLLIVNANAAFYRHLNRLRRDHRRHTLANQFGLFHQHRTE